MRREGLQYPAECKADFSWIAATLHRKSLNSEKEPLVLDRICGTTSTEAVACFVLQVDFITVENMLTAPGNHTDHSKTRNEADATQPRSGSGCGETELLALYSCSAIVSQFWLFLKSHQR